MADATDRRDARPFRIVAGGAEGDAADEPLVRAFLAGDEQAFGDLVRRHERTVLAIVRRYAGASDEARDLAQRAFLRAFQAAKRARALRTKGPVPFRAWLLRIAVNLGKNNVRDARRWRRAPVEAAMREGVPPVGTAALERAERERTVRQAVLSLPRRQREVLTLRVDAELSFKEIAGVLGITENNAKVHFHYAARRLREAVQGEMP